MLYSIISNKFLLRVSLTLIFIGYCSPSFALDWVEIPFDIAGGGVITEIKVLERTDPNCDQLWIASMGGGCLKTEYSSGSWGNWNQYKADRSGMALDVWETGTGADDVAALLGAGGVFISTNNGTSWDRPPGYSNLTTDWMSAIIHGVAFYIDAGGNYDQTKFYVVRKFDQYAGVYRWNSGSNTFNQVTPTIPTEGFFNIIRDVADTNILYFTKDESSPGARDGGLYKLSGDYTASLADVSPTNNIYEVTSFSQDLADPTKAYIVLYRHNSETGEDVWELWLGDPGTGDFESVYEIPSSEVDDEPLWEVDPGICAIGKYEGGAEERSKIWMFGSVFGAKYFEVYQESGNWQITTPEQIVGGTGSLPGLLSWIPRSLTIDPIHTTNVNILLGTYMGRICNLNFTNTSTYSWDDLTEGATGGIGFYGAESR